VTAWSVLKYELARVYLQNQCLLDSIQYCLNSKIEDFIITNWCFILNLNYFDQLTNHSFIELIILWFDYLIDFTLSASHYYSFHVRYYNFEFSFSMLFGQRHLLLPSYLWPPEFDSIRQLSTTRIQFNSIRSFEYLSFQLFVLLSVHFFASSWSLTFHWMLSSDWN